MPVPDERLAKMVADVEQFVEWTDDPEERVDAVDVLDALRELQALRSVGLKQT